MSQNNYANITKINFAGKELDCVWNEDEQELFIGLRRACENIGIDYSRQLKKLKEYHWATVAQMSTVGADGKDREMMVVDLDTFGMWLANINVNKVKPEVRPTLMEYQIKVMKVLRKTFFPSREEVNTAPPQPVLEMRYPIMDLEVIRANFGRATNGFMIDMYEASGRLIKESLFNSRFWNSFNKREMYGKMRKNWNIDDYDYATRVLKSRYGLDFIDVITTNRPPVSGGVISIGAESSKQLTSDADNLKQIGQEFETEEEKTAYYREKYKNDPYGLGI